MHNLPIVMDTHQLVEQKEEFYQSNYVLSMSADAEEECKSEHIIINTSLELGRIKPNFNNFSILCLPDYMRIESCKQV